MRPESRNQSITIFADKPMFSLKPIFEVRRTKATPFVTKGLSQNELLVSFFDRERKTLDNYSCDIRNFNFKP